jgi:hypothetical protein
MPFVSARLWKATWFKAGCKKGPSPHAGDRSPGENPDGELAEGRQANPGSRSHRQQPTPVFPVPTSAAYVPGSTAMNHEVGV